MTKPVLGGSGEQLTGYVLGKKAQEDEERFYRGCMKTGKVLSYHPQWLIGQQGAPGFRTLDALVRTILEWRAFEIDGAAFVHRGDRKKQEDKLADLQRIDGLRRIGIQVRLGIEHVPDTYLKTQPQADAKARSLL